MKREAAELFLFIGGLAALGLSAFGLVLTGARVSAALCCDVAVFTGPGAIGQLGGSIWPAVFFAALGVGLLAAGTRFKS
jgi:hypothetical protein